MPECLQLDSISHAFADKQLFRDLSISIFDQERTVIVGQNGVGKSTLLKILANEMECDEGQRVARKGLSVAYIPQENSWPEGWTAHKAMQSASKGDDLLQKRTCSQFGLDDAFLRLECASLSGGQRKRLAIACEWQNDCDLFLLDEPTNHLDLQSMIWLEGIIQRSTSSFVIVSHDKAFVRNIATRTIELHPRYPGGYLEVRGNYDLFVTTKIEALATLRSQGERMANTLRREQEWLSRGPKARTTKQKARIDRAETLADGMRTFEQNNQGSSFQLQVQSDENRGRILLEAQGVQLERGDRVLCANLDLLITTKDRIGILGENGIGKSTLIEFISGKITSSTGTVKRSERMRVLYLPQNREIILTEPTVARNLSDAGDYVHVENQSIHMRSYLDRFHLPGVQLDAKIDTLSGGQRARLALAKALLQPSNVLILDEPTNDLDEETMNELSIMLDSFDGAVLLVSHDRYFLDRNTNRQIALYRDVHDETKTAWFQGVEQWVDFYQTIDRERNSKSKNQTNNKGSPIPQRAVRLSFQEQKELDTLPKQMEACEKTIAELELLLSGEEFLQDHRAVTDATTRLVDMHAEHNRKMERWLALEEKRVQSESR